MAQDIKQFISVNMDRPNMRLGKGKGKGKGFKDVLEALIKQTIIFNTSKNKNTISNKEKRKRKNDEEHTVFSDPETNFSDTETD